jgi:uncharacterized membrane protein HdeD (DUF308 family)
MSERTRTFVAARVAGILSHSWWTLLLRGLTAIVFGVMVWLRPEISLAMLIKHFGTYALLDGILGVWTALAGRREHGQWWVLHLSGLLSVGVGVLALLSPHGTAVVLVAYISVWAVAKGMVEIATAIRLRKEINGEWRLALGGLSLVGLGVCVMAWPAPGTLALLHLLAPFSLAWGVFQTLLAFELRAHGSRVRERVKSAAPSRDVDPADAPPRTAPRV